MLKFFVNKWFRYFPPEHVQYWKHSNAQEAKVTEQNGYQQMYIKGEKYPFPGFPRGVLLYGELSPLKHQIKNKIFNEAWALMEEGNEKDIPHHVRTKLDEIIEMWKPMRINLIPEKKMVPAVREIWRAWTVVETKFPEHAEKLRYLKEILCFIIQEDDAYRFRLQWLSKFWWPWSDPIKQLEYAMNMAQHAEMVIDMKLRVRLWRTIVLLAFKDPLIKDMYRTFAKELNVRKLRLSKADKYYFRGKYFKVDYPLYEY